MRLRQNLRTGVRSVTGKEQKDGSIDRCYREEELERWIKIGLNDYFSEDNIIIIEWADKLKELLPKDAIFIKFSHFRIIIYGHLNIL